MNPSEVTVIVYQAKGLQGKKKGKHKYNVTFGINNNKAKSENEDSADGCPEWNTEAAIKVDDPLDPLVMKVKDKDDILGQISLHMHELPTSKPARPKHIPLQPHKKAPNPLGELVFVAWISSYTEAVDGNAADQQHEKSSTLKKMKGAVSHSPLFNRKFSLASNTQENLAAQKSKMAAAGINGSNESIDSTISGFSTLSESTKKKKSALKKLKGVFKKSPALGGSKLPGKNSSASCMDLSMTQQSNMLTVRNINLDGSQESLASQTSGFSNLSGLSKDEKKSKNPFKKLKNKMSSSSKLDKANSQSMHNLAFGTSPGFNLQEGNMHGGSSDSLDKLKASAMGKNFPNKFDLTVPKTLLSRSPGSDLDEHANKPAATATTPILGHKRTGSDTQSIHSTGSGKIGTPPPQPKRRMSYQMRSLRDDPRERPKPENSPKSPAKHSLHSAFDSPSHSNIESDSNSIGGDQKSPTSRSLCLPSDDLANTNIRSPGIGSSKEDIRGSKKSNSSQHSNQSFNNTAKDTSHERSMSYGGKSYEEFEAQSTFYTNTESSVSAMSSVGITTKHLVSEENDKKPEISGMSPSEGSIEGGTKITLRGSNLGIDKADVVWLSICGANCLGTLEYFSEYKIRVTTKAWKAGSGKIIIETQSGGRTKSLGDFTFVDYSPKVEEPEEAEINAASSTFYVESNAISVPAVTKQQPTLQSSNHATPAAKQQAPLPPPQKKSSQNQRSEIQNESPHVTVQVKDLMVDQKREDPEGMPMARDEGSLDGDKNSANPVLTNASRPEPTQRKLIKPVQHPSEITNDNSPSREELLELVKALKDENKCLEADNKHMKGYIDRIINRVIDRCPDVLCVDSGLSS